MWSDRHHKAELLLKVAVSNKTLLTSLNYMCVIVVVAFINSNNKMENKEKRPH